MESKTHPMKLYNCTTMEAKECRNRFNINRNEKKN